MNEATLVTIPPLAAHGEDARKRAEERSTLQYWLANEDVYTSAYVRKWLERTPPEEVADTLAQIAEYAHPESRSFFSMFFHGLISMLTTAEIISEKSPAGRKIGIRSAMLLANLNDPRALAPLVRVFETHWFWRGKYQSAIEAALLHLLAGAPEGLDWTPYRADLRAVAENIQQISKGRQELTVRQANLLIGALRHMATVAGETEISLLKTIAFAEARTPLRIRVKEAAEALLQNTA